MEKEKLIEIFIVLSCLGLGLIAPLFWIMLAVYEIANIWTWWHFRRENNRLFERTRLRMEMQRDYYSNLVKWKEGLLE